MTYVHVPSSTSAKALATTVGFIIADLDVVVLIQEESVIYDGSIRMDIQGNTQDLPVALNRARSVGGVVEESTQ